MTETNSTTGAAASAAGPAQKIIPMDVWNKISPADQAALNNALSDAIGVVTNQGREELATFVSRYTPQLAAYGPAAAAGDKVAAQNLKHLQAQMVTDAAIYGVQLVQTQETSLRTAIQVFTKIGVGLILGAATAA